MATTTRFISSLDWGSSVLDPISELEESTFDPIVLSTTTNAKAEQPMLVNNTMSILPDQVQPGVGDRRWASSSSSCGGGSGNGETGQKGIPSKSDLTGSTIVF